MEVNNFPRQLTNVIILKFPGSRGSHLCLHTGKLIPIDQPSGTIPLSNTKMKFLQYIPIITRDVTLRYSFSMYVTTIFLKSNYNNVIWTKNTDIILKVINQI